MANVNTNIIYQAGTLLADVVQQATGRKVLTANTPGEWTSVATTALQGGVEPILNTLANMWARTIFSVRPYSAKLRPGNERGPVRDDDPQALPRGQGPR